VLQAGITYSTVMFSSRESSMISKRASTKLMNEQKTYVYIPL
jgi:hypothetical protein